MMTAPASKADAEAPLERIVAELDAQQRKGATAVDVWQRIGITTLPLLRRILKRAGRARPDLRELRHLDLAGGTAPEHRCSVK